MSKKIEIRGDRNAVVAGDHNKVDAHHVTTLRVLRIGLTVAVTLSIAAYLIYSFS
jgi:hypothetical protein